MIQICNIYNIDDLAGFSFFNTEELSKTFDEFYKRERENSNQHRQRVVAGPSRITAAKVSRKTPKHLQSTVYIGKT